MPDTVRTLAALQALLADNVAGDIGAQDVRDMLVSLAPYTTKVFESGTQSISSASFTSLTFDSETQDDLGWHSTSVNPSRITVDIGGQFLVIGQASLSKGVQTDVSLMARIYINGTTEDSRSGLHIASANVAFVNSYVQVQSVVELAIDDYVEVQGFQTNLAGGALNTITSQSRLTVTYLGPV